MTTLPIPPGPVLAVVAHPDDESFGLGALLAALAAEGRPVWLLCLTRGAASTLGSPDGLAQRRQVELERAAARLGLSQAWLADFPDGDLAGLRPGTLDATVAAHVGDAVALVVFEPGGVTGHPDHQAATAAAERVADTRCLPVVEWGVSPEVAAMLWRQVGLRFTALDHGPHVVTVPVDRTAQRAAIACHRSQHNPVVARRLALQGNFERVRLRAPAETERCCPRRPRPREEISWMPSTR